MIRKWKEHDYEHISIKTLKQELFKKSSCYYCLNYKDGVINKTHNNNLIYRNICKQCLKKEREYHEQ